MHFFSNNKFVIFLLVIVFLVVLIFSIDFNKGKAYGYKAIRNVHKAYMGYMVRDYGEVSEGNFIVKYTGISEETALLVAQTGEELFKPVSDMLGFTPQHTVPVIVYPTKEALNESFGWEGDKSAMGVYWMGMIRVLAPEVWVDTDDIKEKALFFKTQGPMAHEFAHFVVDYKTNGNYTRWFTEGIAQYVEKELTGFVLEEPRRQEKENIYSFSHLDRDYDDQPNQELAYWQSLVAIEYLIEKYDPIVLKQLLQELSQGKDMDTTFRNIVGKDISEFENVIKKHISKLLLEEAA